MSERRRIGMLITELELGGAEQRFCDVACGVDRERFDVRVCSLGPRPLAPKDALAIRLEEAGIDVAYLDVTGAWQLPSAVRKLRRWFESHQLHAAQSFLFHANVLSSWAAPNNVKLSLGLRVADPRRWRSWLERRAARRAQKIVCVSEMVKTFAASTGFPGEKLLVIENGIELSDTLPTSRAELGATEEQPLIVFVGRLDRQKGVDWLVENAKAWLRDAGDVQVRLIGDGPLRRPLSRLLEAEAVGDVRLLGWQPGAARAIAAADLLVLPSRWEGMPNVVMEAMALGKPVLCARAEGVTRLLGERAAAQTAEFGDIEDWAGKTSRLIKDADQRRALGDANRKRIAEHFSLATMVARFEALFSSLTQSS